MIKIGITGGIGSGKTYICEKFKKLGIKVYNADENAKKLININQIIRTKLIDNFGDKIYINSKLNKEKLSEIIFNNPEKLKIVNSIVHPEVNKDFELWCNKNISEKIIIKEAAILFESDSYKNVDKIISVISPIELRIKRILLREKTTENEIYKKINNQISDIEKIKKSDFIIYNDNIINLDNQIIKIFNILNS